MQVQSLPTTTATKGQGRILYSGPFDCIRQIYQQHGLLGIYKGQAATVVRECGGFGFYFLLYEELIQRTLKAHPSKSRNDLETWRVCLYGGLAGYAMWLPIFPVDVIKSKIQTDGFSPSSSIQKRMYSSTWDCVKQTFAKDGIGGFYRGLLPCLLRAAPVNAATFLGFELAMRWLK